MLTKASSYQYARRIVILINRIIKNHLVKTRWFFIIILIEGLESAGSVVIPVSPVISLRII